MENFVAVILNKVYDYNLSNLNEKKANFPGIDIGDIKKKLGFQISSTKSSSKINETIQKVTDDRHGVYKEYNNLKFFILTYKQTSYTINKYDTTKIQFNSKEDILDFDDIYLKSMYLPVGKQKELVDYIYQQVPYVADQMA